VKTVTLKKITSDNQFAADAAAFNICGFPIEIVIHAGERALLQLYNTSDPLADLDTNSSVRQ
jgi:hypothetical protein